MIADLREEGTTLHVDRLGGAGVKERRAVRLSSQLGVELDHLVDYVNEAV
jgi:hypothetical protein